MEDMDVSPEIVEARERIAKARAELEQPRVVNSTPEPEVQVAESRQSVPAPMSDELTELKQKYAELQKEQSRRDGIYGSELDKLRKSLQLSSDQNAMLTKKFEEKPEPVVEEVKDEDWEVRRVRYMKDLPQEVRNEYEESSLDAMARISERTTREVLKSELEKLRKSFPAFNEQTRQAVPPELADRIEKMEKSSAYSEFSNAVEQMAPGFSKVNGNEYLKIPADPEWIKFLESQKDDYETWHHYCERIGGPKVAATAYLQFKRTSTSVADPSAGVVGQVSPTKSGASGTVSDKSNRVYSWAEYEKFKEDFFRGAFDDDRTKALDIMETYKKAAQDGRLK